MVKERKKRVAMTKKLKKEVFMACLVRVLRGTLPVGVFKAVAEPFNVRPKTVSKVWHKTMKMVPGYQSNAPHDPLFVDATVPAEAFETKFQNAGRKPQFDHETVLQEIRML